MPDDLHSSPLVFLRAVAVITRGPDLLLARETTDDFWYLPGSHIKSGETSFQAVQRAVLDEIGSHARIGEMRFIHENFFTHAGAKYHEVGLYFDVELESGCDALTWRAVTARTSSRGIQHEFRWQPIDRLSIVDLRPRSIAERLPFNVTRTLHVVDVR